MEPAGYRVQYRSLSGEGEDFQFTSTKVNPVITTLPDTMHFVIEGDNLFGQKIEAFLVDCKGNNHKVNMSISTFCDQIILAVLVKYRECIACLDLSKCSAEHLLDPSIDGLAAVVDKIDKVILPSDSPSDINVELITKIMALRGQSLPTIIIDQ